MKIAMLQLNPLIGDVKGNFEKIANGYNDVVKKGAELVVTHELALIGYPPRDLLQRRELFDAQQEYLSKLCGIIEDVPLVIGIIRKNGDDGKPYFNSVAVIQNGGIIYTQDKYLLPTYDVFDEGRYFEPGKDLPSIVKIGDKRLAFLNCEDIWNGSEVPRYKRKQYHIDPLEYITHISPDILIVINASPYYFGKGRFRYGLVADIADKLDCTVIYVNQVGGNDSLIFDGRSFALDQSGECLAACRPFQEEWVIFDIGNSRSLDCYFNDTLEDVIDGLTLGIRDYYTKCGFRNGALVALSGGIDSALVAYLAARAIGPEKVLCVGMPSAYSSPESLEDARQLCVNLGLCFAEAGISEIFSAFRKTLGPHIDWNEPGTVPGDPTEENLQARIRGNLIMAFSNKLGRLLLSTGNKSEIAMGYCTLYGDTNGGLAPISDVPKTMVQKIVRHIIETEGLIPERILTKPPSAELAPGQRDEDALPPYPILDEILDRFIEERQGVHRIIEAGFDEATAKNVLGRVWRNEYKRQQTPPGLIITSKSLTSIDWRYPIACKYPE